MKHNRHGCYEDYAREIDEDAERKAHEARECEGYPICFICLDERDVDDMAEHVNKELESEAAKWRDAENRAMKEGEQQAKERSERWTK
jgi:hypothetical protein